MTLHPGDVVLTGAPGRSLRLTPGGASTVSIPGIGTLTNPVARVETATRQRNSSIRPTTERER